MLIVTMLRSKGDFVATVPPTATVRELLAVLAEQRIGAAVVSTGDGSRASCPERDDVRHLGDEGGALLDRPVSANHDGRRRHLWSADRGRRPRPHHDRATYPPRTGGRRRGRARRIVSIGDVVKSRISELESERDDLVGYIGTR